jgi:hypothetical protein
MSVAYAIATTCCAAGARAVGTRRGDGPSRGLAPKADGAGWLREMARTLKVDGATNVVGEEARGLSLVGGAFSEVRRCNCSVVD